MNDRYAGDVGDFSKVGWLRLLGRCARERGEVGAIAVLWWATRQAGGADGDGRHVRYLSESRYARADAELLAGLRNVVAGGRSIAALERHLPFPEGTVFHGEPLDAGEPLSPRRRALARTQWLARAAQVARAAPFIFLDPDDGLATAKMRPTQASARKKVFLDELPVLAGSAQTLVVYHHPARKLSHVEQAAVLRSRLQAAFPGHLRPVVLRAPRYSARFYAVVPAVRHRAVLEGALGEVRTERWATLLEEVP